MRIRTPRSKGVGHATFAVSLVAMVATGSLLVGAAVALPVAVAGELAGRMLGAQHGSARQISLLEPSSRPNEHDDRSLPNVPLLAASSSKPMPTPMPPGLPPRLPPLPSRIPPSLPPPAPSAVSAIAWGLERPAPRCQEVFVYIVSEWIDGNGIATIALGKNSRGTRERVGSRIGPYLVIAMGSRQGTQEPVVRLLRDGKICDAFLFDGNRERAVRARTEAKQQSRGQSKGGRGRVSGKR